MDVRPGIGTSIKIANISINYTGENVVENHNHAHPERTRRIKEGNYPNTGTIIH